MKIWYPPFGFQSGAMNLSFTVSNQTQLASHKFNSVQCGNRKKNPKSWKNRNIWSSSLDSIIRISGFQGIARKHHTTVFWCVGWKPQIKLILVNLLVKRVHFRDRKLIFHGNPQPIAIQKIIDRVKLVQIWWWTGSWLSEYLFSLDRRFLNFSWSRTDKFWTKNFGPLIIMKLARTYFTSLWLIIIVFLKPVKFLFEKHVRHFISFLLFQIYMWSVKALLNSVSGFI